jgi:hypothetical protein
MGYLGPF